MRILQVGTGFIPVLPGVTGGAEKHIYHLSAALQRLGHQVTVIDMPVPSRPAFNYRLIEVPLRWRYDFNLVAHAVRGLLWGRAVAQRLEQLIRAGEVDVIHFHSQFGGFVGMPIARRRSIPTAFTMHNALWSDLRACRSRLNQIRFWMERKVEAQSDAVIYTSSTLAKNRIRVFGVDPNKTHVISNGIAESWFEPHSVSAATVSKYAPCGEKIILSVARIAPYKNQLTLAMAAPQILEESPEARIVFVGPVLSASYREQIRRVLKQTGTEAKVLFVESIPGEELGQLYEIAKVFVLPSMQETCPLALLEAMAQGKAIVASDVAWGDIRSADVGISIPPREHRTLASSVTRLLKDSSLRRDFGMRARQRAYEVCRWEKVAPRIVEAYHPLTRRPAEVARGVG